MHIYAHQTRMAVYSILFPLPPPFPPYYTQYLLVSSGSSGFACRTGLHSDLHCEGLAPPHLCELEVWLSSTQATWFWTRFQDGPVLVRVCCSVRAACLVGDVCKLPHWRRVQRWLILPCWYTQLPLFVSDWYFVPLSVNRKPELLAGWNLLSSPLMNNIILFLMFTIPHRSIAITLERERETSNWCFFLVSCRGRSLKSPWVRWYLSPATLACMWWHLVCWWQPSWPSGLLWRIPSGLCHGNGQSSQSQVRNSQCTLCLCDDIKKHSHMLGSAVILSLPNTITTNAVH